MIVIDPIIFKLQKYGGISKYFEEFIKYLEENGIEYTILSSERRIFKYLPLSIKRFFPVDLVYTDFKTGSNFISSYFTYSISGVDLLICHDFTHEKYLGGNFKKISFMFLRQLCIFSSKAIVCISNSTKKDLLDIYHVPISKKIYIIHNGISNVQPKEFQHNYSDFFIFIGSRVSYKNFYYAVELCKKNNKFLLIIGGGELNSFEKQILKDCRHDFISYISTEHYYYLMRCSNGIIYPSSYEGFGIPAHESYFNDTPFFFNESCIALKEISLSNSCELTMILEVDIDIINSFSYNKKLNKSNINYWEDVFDNLMKIL